MCHASNGQDSKPRPHDRKSDNLGIGLPLLAFVTLGQIYGDGKIKIISYTIGVTYVKGTSKKSLVI